MTSSVGNRRLDFLTFFIVLDGQELSQSEQWSAGIVPTFPTTDLISFRHSTHHLCEKAKY